MMDAPTTDRWIRCLNLLQLVLAGIIIMTPTVWMVLSSFKPSFEVTAYPPTLIFAPTMENYVQLTKTTPFVSYAVNSLIVTIGSTALGLLFGIPAAFAVSWSRITWPAILTLAARMAPGTLFLLPWYVMFRQIGMIGSYTALVLSNGDTKTLIAAAFNFVGEGSTQWGALMAAATLIALPPLILAALVQRWLVSGLTLGAVKG